MDGQNHHRVLFLMVLLSRSLAKSWLIVFRFLIIDLSLGQVFHSQVGPPSSGGPPSQFRGSSIIRKVLHHAASKSNQERSSLLLPSYIGMLANIWSFDRLRWPIVGGPCMAYISSIRRSSTVPNLS